MYVCIHSLQSWEISPFSSLPYKHSQELHLQTRFLTQEMDLSLHTEVPCFSFETAHYWNFLPLSVFSHIFFSSNVKPVNVIMLIFLSLKHLTIPLNSPPKFHLFMHKSISHIFCKADLPF